MVRLGYKPVGKDFPVFLHPRTHEEYALARTERKSGKSAWPAWATPATSGRGRSWSTAGRSRR